MKLSGQYCVQWNRPKRMRRSVYFCNTHHPIIESFRMFVCWMYSRVSFYCVCVVVVLDGWQCGMYMKKIKSLEASCQHLIYCIYYTYLSIYIHLCTNQARYIGLYKIEYQCVRLWGEYMSALIYIIYICVQIKLDPLEKIR
jgi:hypothetical protein